MRSYCVCVCVSYEHTNNNKKKSFFFFFKDALLASQAGWSKKKKKKKQANKQKTPLYSSLVSAPSMHVSFQQEHFLSSQVFVDAFFFFFWLAAKC